MSLLMAGVEKILVIARKPIVNNTGLKPGACARDGRSRC
jgi:hypothetical protein